MRGSWIVKLTLSYLAPRQGGTTPTEAKPRLRRGKDAISQISKDKIGTDEDP